MSEKTPASPQRRPQKASGAVRAPVQRRSFGQWFLDVLDAVLPDLPFMRRPQSAQVSARNSQPEKAQNPDSPFSESALPVERQPNNRPPLARSAAYENYFGSNGDAPAASALPPTAGFAPKSPASPVTGGVSEEWIGVDLDGTLAMTSEWRGLEHIGPPVPLMIARVQHWLANGIRVKIFTARATYPEAIPPIRRWLSENDLPATLEITNVKDFAMLELWDDRAIQVVQDTGRPFLSDSITGRPKTPILPYEAENGTYFHVPFSTPENDRDDEDDEL